MITYKLFKKGKEMNLIQYAKTELKLGGFFDKGEDGLYDGEIGPAVMELIKVFAEQGHSGMSASIVRNLFNKLANYKPLGPITGKDDEWADEALSNDVPYYQNRRLSSVFKEGKNSTAYYLDAIVFKDQEGHTFTGTVDLPGPDNKVLSSRQYIKKFPFTPKTFYIDVESTRWKDKEKTRRDVNGDQWTHLVSDTTQLEKVWEYYDQWD